MEDLCTSDPKPKLALRESLWGSLPLSVEGFFEESTREERRYIHHHTMLVNFVRLVTQDESVGDHDQRVSILDNALVDLRANKNATYRVVGARLGFLNGRRYSDALVKHHYKLDPITFREMIESGVSDLLEALGLNVSGDQG